MSESSSASPRPGPAKTGRDYGRLSRRIADWTTSGLATALVLLAGITLGRQVLVWWGESPALPIAHQEGSRPSDAAVRQLEFGALATSIQTRSVRGSRSEVLLALRDLCRPASRPERPAGSHADAAEQRLLAELAGKEPAESGDGWRIDEFPRGMPLVVCSMWDSVKRNSAVPLPLDLRIVSIGLAVPGEDNQWTAYAFAIDGSSSAVDGGAQIPLPEGSSGGMTLRQPDGSVLTTFRGPGEPAAWEEHFRTRLAKDGWQIQSELPSAHGRWQAVFAKAGANPLRAEVHFEYDGQGGLHGLVLVAPADKP